MEGMEGIMGQLAEVLERVMLQRTERKESFKTPTYDGKGDVEYFLTQFQEVADANEWADGAAMIHMREALKDEARDCGKAATLGGIITALQARFGLTPREARARLSSMRRDPKTTLQAHATEVERLTEVAYAGLPRGNKEELALDAFHNTLGNAYLQRHLLAIKANSLEEAVRAGNEYLQVKILPMPGGVRQVEVEENEGSGESGTRIAPIKEDPLLSITKILTKMDERLEALENQRRTVTPARNPNRGSLSNPTWAPGRGPPTRDRDTGRVTCWGCGQEGHVRRECHQQPLKQHRSQGNDQSPQQ
jgi:hypothetical protein